MKFKFLGLIILIFIISSCENKQDFVVKGYKPIYIDKANIHDISITAPVPMVNPGKIYLYGTYVFINERGRGVHVINNVNPHSPQKINFINIPGNYDIAIRNNFLYADNASDLVTVNISNLSNIQVVSRISDVYDVKRQMYPDFAGGYFECVDTTRGFVIGWYEEDLVNPKCRR